jgi:hypothetical protein
MRGRLFLACIAAAMVTGCGLTGSGAGSSSVHATPTPNPEVARVKAAVTAFIEAYDKSGETGNSDSAEALTLPGSAAVGNADMFAAAAIDGGKGFAVVRVDIDPMSWDVVVTGDSAVVDVSWKTYGHWISYPQGQTLGPDHEDPGYKSQLELKEVGGRWLVESFT